MSAFTQFFLNPAFVLPGAALCLLPIIIHLLSRLRYKKVRFAAMEFLLQSDELNRRRLIIEQLLLLFLRVLAVFLIMLLLARLLLDTGFARENPAQPGVPNFMYPVVGREACACARRAPRIVLGG